jgi:hypothetical protein
MEEEKCFVLFSELKFFINSYITVVVSGDTIFNEHPLGGREHLSTHHHTSTGVDSCVNTI